MISFAQEKVANLVKCQKNVQLMFWRFPKIHLKMQMSLNWFFIERFQVHTSDVNQWELRGTCFLHQRVWGRNVMVQNFLLPDTVIFQRKKEEDRIKSKETFKMQLQTPRTATYWTVILLLTLTMPTPRSIILIVINITESLAFFLLHTWYCPGL